MDAASVKDHPPHSDTNINAKMTSESTTTVDTNGTTITTQDPLDSALADKQTKDYDSSDLELSSSDDELSSEDEELTRLDNDDDDDDEDGHGQTTAIPKSKNELTDIAIDTPTVKEITAEMQIDTIGEIVNVLDKTVVVQQQAGCATVLDMGSLLVFVDDRHVLGEVFETFGPVELPFYSVRFNSVDDIDPVRTVKGARIGYVPAYERTQLVQVEQLKLIKGTDASNQYDEEVGADEIEFSDDEKEMEYRRKTKKKGKQNQTKPRPQKRPLEDAPIPDGRRPLQSYEDIITTTSSSSRPPPTQQQHPDAMTALLDSYMTNQPYVTKAPVSSSQTQAQQPQAQQPPQQPEAQQAQQPPQQPEAQQEKPPLQRQSSSSSFFQSIRSLFSRAPPPS